MNNYIKLNEDRWNNVKNDYTEPLTHEELEEVRNNPISVALTVGKKVPKEWFEKANGKKIYASTSLLRSSIINFNAISARDEATILRVIEASP